MIQIYDIGNENYDRNGNAVLTPTAGRVTMQAGGACDISLTLPMDPDGKWRHVVPGAVVKAPVPREVIENSFSGYAADIYKTTGQADLREDKVAPTPISYPQWNAMDMTYTVGSRVSCYGWPHQNYECTYFDNSSPITQVPPYNSAWWKPIADYTPGAAVVVSLPAGSELYWIENAGSGWYKMSTYYGLEGYIQTSAVVFDRHVSETENQPRIITEQLFRLREPSINNETRTVTVTGQHVSYDLAGILCKNITITQASPAMAMGRVVENMMMDYRGTIATNLTSEENGTYTGKTNGKNGMFMLLDPDAGIVHAFNAKFTRDNWDVFVMKKTSALSGFRISYAKNMRGVTWKKSSAGLVTRVVPVAKNTDGEDLYLPEKWVDSAHIAEYPVVLMELLRISAQVGRDDGTGTDTVWTESALFDYMREKAGERFSVDHVDEVVDDLTVQFEQLGDTAEYEWIRPLESVLLYDNIVCQDRDIGLEKVLTVTELEWDPIRRKVTGIRLSNITGAAGRTVTGFNVQNNSITPAKLTEEVTQEIVGQVQALIPDYTDPQAGKYTLPPASSTALGGIKIGFQESGKNYPVALDANNKAYVYVPWDPGSYTLPLAQDGVRGGIQIGFTASGKNYPVALSGEKAYVYVPWTADGGNAATVNGHSVNTDVPAGAVFTDHYDWSDITNKPATATRWPTWAEVTGKPTVFYTLPLAGDGTRGGVQVGYTQSGQNYPVQLSGEKMYVNVPWTDTDKSTKFTVVKQISRGADFDPITSGYFAGMTTQSGITSNWWHILSMDWDNDDKNNWISQLALPTEDRNGIYYRTRHAGTTNAWVKCLDANNYTDYTVTKTGGGASGSWGISITGNAATATKLAANASDTTASFWRGDNTWSKTLTNGLNISGGKLWVNSSPGTNHADYLEVRSSYSDNTHWAACIKNAYNANSTGWGTGLKIANGSESETDKWIGIRSYAATVYSNKTDMDFYTSATFRMRLSDDRLIPAANDTYYIGDSALKWKAVFATRFWGELTGNVTGNCSGSAGSVAWSGVGNPPATATRWPTWDEVTGKPNRAGSDSDGGVAYSSYKLADFNVSNVGYATNDTHMLQIGYFNAHAYAHATLLVTCEFWGNQHGSSDLIDIQLDNSSSGTLNFTIGRIRISGNKTRTFYYRTDGNSKVYIYAYVEGGNSYGRWAVSKIQDTYDCFTPQFQHNVSVTTTGTIPYTGDIGNAATAGSATNATNADKVDGFHGVDLLTEVDSQKHRLQIRTGSGSLVNNTDTYIPFSSPFSTYCAAVIPVSTSGFNAPNALSIVSNNTNGVTLKQNNAMGVSMNVIVLAVGY